MCRALQWGLRSGVERRSSHDQGWDCRIGIGWMLAIEQAADLSATWGIGHSVVHDFMPGGATEDMLDDLI